VAAARVEVTALAPPAPEGGRQPESALGIAALGRIAEAGRQVVAFGAQLRKPFRTVRPVQMRLGRLGKGDELVEVAFLKALKLTGLPGSSPGGR